MAASCNSDRTRRCESISVRAVSTGFAVAHHKREVIVTVAEGAVRVAPSSRHVDVRYELAWRERQLMFRAGDTLADTAAEFNLRNRVQLRVDPEAASLPVRGTFHASDPVAFAQTLLGTAPIVIEKRSSDVLLIRHR